MRGDPLHNYDEDRISGVVGQLLKAPNPRIEESLFVRKYLPMFAANLPHNAKIDEYMPTLAWLEVAIWPYNEVDVFKGNQVLFRVPPLLGQVGPMLTAFQSVRGGLAGLMRQANDNYKRIPKLGTMHLQQHVVAKLKPAVVPTPYVERWNEIFKRYGYNEAVVELNKPAVAAAPVAVEAVKTAPAIDFDNYTEL